MTGRFSIIITSSISSVPFFSFWYSHYMYVTPFVIVPVFGYSFFFSNLFSLLLSVWESFNCDGKCSEHPHFVHKHPSLMSCVVISLDYRTRVGIVGWKYNTNLISVFIQNLGWLCQCILPPLVHKGVTFPLYSCQYSSIFCTVLNKKSYFLIFYFFTSLIIREVSPLFILAIRISSSADYLFM